MSKIDEYNDAVKGLNVLGLTLTNEQQLQLRKMLDAIISEEILPSISEKIAPLVAKINSPLTLVIDHIPGEEMSLRSTQTQVEINDSDSKVYKLVPYIKSEPTKKNKVKKKPAPATLLTIKFPDGTSICEADSNQTMVAAIEKIGVSRVLDGGFTLVGKPIVSITKPNWQGVFELGNYYIYTSASNKDKIKDLTKMSKALGLGLTFSTDLKPKKSKK